ncbi:MAG: ATP synthase F0 subunit C [Kiritimatiellaeota bacterium]|nr:ATP synthase F0 subunit C [Kiritimatiellota bacterium]
MILPLAIQGTAALGASITVIGASLGIGLLWMAGMQSMARQPELQSQIQKVMIVGAAFIEGAALFAIVVCYLKG